MQMHFIIHQNNSSLHFVMLHKKFLKVFKFGVNLKLAGSEFQLAATLCKIRLQQLM